MAALQSELAALQARSARRSAAAQRLPLTRAPCHSRQAAVAAKEAQLAAAAAGAAAGAPAAVADVAAPYSKSYGRTSIIAVHASAGAGLSLVRHLRSTTALRVGPAACLSLRRAMAVAAAGGADAGCMRRLGKRCVSEAG